MTCRINSQWNLLWANHSSEHEVLLTFDDRNSARSWLRFFRNDETAMRALRTLLGEREGNIYRLSADQVIDSLATRLASREVFVIQHRPSTYLGGMRRVVPRGPKPNEPPRNHKESLLLKETLADHNKREKSSTIKVEDAPRLSALYDGPENAWVKICGPNWVIDLVRTEVHYFKNLVTGRIAEWKFIRQPLQPGADDKLLHQPDRGDNGISPLLDHKVR